MAFTLGNLIRCNYLLNAFDKELRKAQVETFHIVPILERLIEYFRGDSFDISYEQLKSFLSAVNRSSINLINFYMLDNRVKPEWFDELNFLLDELECFVESVLDQYQKLDLKDE